MRITHDVVLDLWPLYAAGEASADTRALVDEFLREHPDFARKLEGAGALPAAEVSMPPDQEARALSRTRDLVQGRGWLRGLRLLALALTGLALLHVAQYTEALFRIARDAQAVESPTRCVAEAVAAFLAWLLYVVLARWHRVRALRSTAAH
jgi:hypothetical protein